MPLLGLDRRRSFEQDTDQCHSHGEDHRVADDTDVSQLHVARDHAAQSAKRQQATDDQEPACPQRQTAAAEDRCGEQHRQGEEDVPAMMSSA
jgi:hypothetical protein